MNPRIPPAGRIAALALALCLPVSFALAESTYGYNAAGTGTVTANARVNLSVTVPKMILLRVGGTNTAVDTLAWTATASIPAVPTVPPATADNVNVDWNGAAPTFTLAAQPAAVSVYAWTNAGAATIVCAVGAWSGTGAAPAIAGFTVAATGTLPHPGANLGVCGSTTIPANVVATGTWTYTLAGSALVNSVAGVRTATVTYTVTGI